MRSGTRPRWAWLTLVLMLGGQLAAAPLGSAFTWQGQLRDAGGLANGLYDFQFCLFETAVDPSPLACAPDLDDIPVDSGVFSVELDFGSATFSGQQRHLELRVRPGAAAGEYTILSPRQLIRPAPEALRAKVADLSASAASAPWSGLTGIPQGFADGVDDSGVVSITAGSGLSGGMITGSGTLAVDTDQIQARVSSFCGNNTSLRQINANGTVACQQNVAAITPGPGISSSFNNGIATVGLTPGGVGLTQIDVTQVQARIAAGCNEGEYLRAINVDGSVVCEPLAIDINRLRALTASGAQAQLGVALAVTANDRALVAFRNGGTQLALYRCENPSCSTGTVRNLEPGGSAPSIVLRVDGRPLIAHHDPIADDLRLYDCADAACAFGIGSALDATGAVGREPRLALRPDGRPLISYRDQNVLGLKLYNCANPQCSSGVSVVLDSSGNSGANSALAVRSDGRALIAYSNITPGELRLYRCDNVECSSGNSISLDGTLNDPAGQFPSIVLRADGRALISYAVRPSANRFGLAAYDCSDVNCSSGVVRQLLDLPEISVGAFTSIALRANGRALISYRQVTNPQVGLFDCADSGCSSGAAVGLDSIGNPGFYSAIGLRSDGRPLIAHGRGDDGNLGLFVCGSGNCQ